MASIEEMNKTITIYYSKSSGEIKSYASGLQNMDFFGKDKEDYSLIWDYLQVPYDEEIFINSGKFIVENRELKLKKSAVNNYAIAEADY